MHLPYVASTLSFGGYIEVLCQHIPVRYGSLDKILAKANLVADPAFGQPCRNRHENFDVDLPTEDVFND
ncbi:hypothetical protein AtubIFM55763_004909 [Aspergillus tubingensis]|uniref:Uncharacterized protein n=1 Tax=Aspergillus tubingensis TaxID=5068 RepID=A0A9W6EKX5_ASPTU|nr:hypothetical protein AtubIFM55763_004909 [Aspergillus tubingensis]GLA84806.1 hypothetical protein AtubIFM56815_009021 [Aspergillus tubingensis]